MVKIPCAGPGHKRNIIMWSTGQGNTKCGRRLAGLRNISVPHLSEVVWKEMCLTKIQFRETRNLCALISF
jgi:hypothetical protein